MKRSERQALVAAITRPYLTSKKDRNILSQYERAEPGPDSRIRTVLSPVVTETGRLASGESFVDPFSTNLQNLSKKEAFKDELYRVRDIFIPDPGMLLLASDLDKAEAVVIAFESGNLDIYNKLIAGEDIHSWIAAHAYHSGNLKSVTKPERQRSKNVGYASFYRAGVPKITRTINADATSRSDRLTEAEVAKVHAVVLDLWDLPTWWDSVWSDLMSPDTHGGTRWLGNCLDFRRMFYHPDHHKLWTEAINFIPQSTIASWIDRVLIAWWEQLEAPGRAELLLQIHDELLTQVIPDRIPHYAHALRDLMQAPFTSSHGDSVHIPAGLEVGHRWEVFRGPDSEPFDPENALGRMTSFTPDANDQ